jgi:hypothetical protein
MPADLSALVAATKPTHSTVAQLSGRDGLPRIRGARGRSRRTAVRRRDRLGGLVHGYYEAAA